ncbi:hypothetical protein BH20ACT2_BH20ACT2_11810 [soil metagenome]
MHVGADIEACGTTWWGRAWVGALEHRARLDPNRLPRGRTYARKGRVLSVSLRQGEIRATVNADDPESLLEGTLS